MTSLTNMTSGSHSLSRHSLYGEVCWSEVPLARVVTAPLVLWRWIFEWIAQSLSSSSHICCVFFVCLESCSPVIYPIHCCLELSDSENRIQRRSRDATGKQVTWAIQHWRMVNSSLESCCQRTSFCGFRRGGTGTGGVRNSIPQCSRISFLNWRTR